VADMKTKVLSIALLMTQASLFAASDSNVSKLGEVNVIGNNYKFPTVILKNTPTAKTVINAEELKKSMGAGGANIFKALKLVPSVSVESDGPYGLTGGQMRVRGYTQQEIGVELDGMPLNDTGNFAIYPHEYADSGNLYSIALTRGSTNIAEPFYSDIGGSVQLKTKLPKRKFSAQIDQRTGTYGFYKGFYRVDSGEFSTGTRLFGSYSHAKANKWKGPGKAPSYRDHYALGLSQKIKNSYVDLFYDYNTQLNYSYKYHQMDWKKAQDYQKYYKLDYNNNPNSADYYKLNTNPYKNQELRSNIVVPFLQNVKLKINPYIWIGKGGGYYSYGATNKITYGQSLNYTNKYGTTAKIDTNFNNVNIQVGLFNEYADLKNFSNRFKGANGDDILADLTGHFKYWNYIYRTKTKTTMPFFAIKQKNIAGIFDYKIGAKYAMVKRDVKSYNTYAVKSYYPKDEVYHHLGPVDKDASYIKTYRKFLPRAQFGVNINDNSYAYISYARTFKVPGNRLKSSNGTKISTQSAINNLKPEVANTYNLGYRYTTDSYYVASVIYYSKYSDKIINTPTKDPTVSIPKNVGSTTAKGIEIESGVNINKNVSLYGAYGYNRAIYGKDYYYKKTLLKVKGNQLVDTPKHTLGISLSYKKDRFKGTISAKYRSSRYGDATNTQKVDGYTIFNVYANKKFKFMGTKMSAFVSVHNLFNKKYIGKIAAGDTNGYYYAGTPRVVTVGIGGKF
jgi:iron complex outermembrane receptor protein